MGNTTDKLRAAIASKEAISSAIIERGGTLAADAPLSAYAGAVTSSLVNTDSATATAADLRVGRSAYTSGGRLIHGSIPDATVTSGATTYEITSGYLASALSLERGGGGSSTVLESELCVFSGGLSANIGSTGTLVLFDAASATVNENCGTLVLVGAGASYNGTQLPFSNGSPAVSAAAGPIINTGMMTVCAGSDYYALPNVPEVTNCGALYLESADGVVPTAYTVVYNQSGGVLYAPAGTIYNYDGATIDCAYSGGCIPDLIMSGGTATLSDGELQNLTISGGETNLNNCSMTGSQEVFGGALNASGCDLMCDLIISGGKVCVATPGTVCNFQVFGGVADLYDTDAGGAASVCLADGTVNLYGSTAQLFMSGGTANFYGSNTSTCMVELGMLNIMPEACANCVTLAGSGVAILSSANMDSTNIGYNEYGGITGGGTLEVHDGGRCNNTSVADSAVLTLSSGGYALATTLNGGVLTISSGAQADEVYMSGGSLYVCSGGTATMVSGDSTSVTVEDGGSVEFM